MRPVFMLMKLPILLAMTVLKFIRARANIFCLTKLPAMIWYMALYSLLLPKIPKAFWFAQPLMAIPFIGPNANDMEDKEDTSVTAGGMDQIIASARKLIPNLPMGAAITEFAGLRAVSDTGDFIIGASEVEGLFNAAGMQSPGLTAAPAVAEEIAEAVGKFMPLEKKADFKAALPKQIHFTRLTDNEKHDLIEKDPLFGRVICRCETVTEGEIVAAIKAPCGATTVDAVKRRTRAGMGRCQGGFCGPRVTQILARELGISVADVLKERKDPIYITKKTDVKGGQE